MLSSLLYADDLIFLPRSKQALRNGLNRLLSFLTWKLDVKLKKSKIIIFQYEEDNNYDYTVMISLYYYIIITRFKTNGLNSKLSISGKLSIIMLYFTRPYICGNFLGRNQIKSNNFYQILVGTFTSW